MKSTEDSLFNLVQSMSLGEKIQFKREQKDNKVDFIQLFDILQDMPEYDKNKLKEKADKKLGTKDIRGIKNYLYKTLIDFLIDYNRSNSIAGQLKGLIDKSLMLYRKGLFNESKAIIEEAKKMAEHYEFDLELLELNDIELNLALKFSKRDMQPFKGLIKERKSIMRKIEVFDEYRNIAISMSILQNKSNRFMEKPAILLQANKIMGYPLMKKYPDKEPFYCKYVFLITHYRYQFLIGDKIKKKDYLEQLINLWMGKIQMKERLKLSFLSCLFVYLDEEFRTKYFVRFPELIPQTETGYKEFKVLGLSYHFSGYLILKTWIALHQANWPLAIQLLQETFNTFKEKNMPPFYFEKYIIAQMRGAVLNLLANDYKTANKHLNWLAKNCSEQNGDILFKEKILRMITAHDAHEYFFLGELVNAAEQYFTRHNRQHEIEKVFIKYFKKISRSNNANERNEHLKELRIKLSTSFDVMSLEDYFTFDPLIWVDSKLNEKPAMDIFKEKALNNYPEILSLKI